jgi:hypothetical protein
MGSIGDLVATLGVDDSKWGSVLVKSEMSAKGFANTSIQAFESPKTAIETYGNDIELLNSMLEKGMLSTDTYSMAVQKLQVSITGAGEGIERLGGHATGTYRSFNFLGREIEHAGGALSGMNAGAGEVVEKMGGAVGAIGMAQHTVHGLGVAYQWLAAQEVIAAAFAGPVGWIALAAGITAAAGALIYFGTSAAESREEIEKLAGKTSELEEAISRVQNSTGNDYLDFLNREKQQTQETIKLYKDQIKEEEKAHASVEDIAHSQKMLNSYLQDQLQTVKDIKKEQKREQAEKAEEQIGKNDQRIVDDLRKQVHDFEAKRGKGAEDEFGIKEWDITSNTKRDEYEKLAETRRKQIAQETVENLTKEIELKHQSAEAREREHIAAAKIGEEDKKRLLARYDELELNQKNQKEQEKTAAAAKKLTDSLASPLEKYNSKIAEFQKLLNEKAITSETFERARDSAAEQYYKDIKPKKEKFEQSELPKVAEFGTESAYTEILRLTGQTPDKDEYARATSENTAELVNIFRHGGNGGQAQIDAFANDAGWEG